MIIHNQILKNLAIHNNKTIGYILQKMGGLPNVVKAVGGNEIIGNFATNNAKSTEENEVKIIRMLAKALKQLLYFYNYTS